MTFKDHVTLYKLMNDENRSKEEDKTLAYLFLYHIDEEFDITIEHIIEELDDDENYNAGDELLRQMANLLDEWRGLKVMDKKSDIMILEHIHDEFSGAINYLINYYREDDDD